MDMAPPQDGERAMGLNAEFLVIPGRAPVPDKGRPKRRLIVAVGIPPWGESPWWRGLFRGQSV